MREEAFAHTEGGRKVWRAFGADSGPDRARRPPPSHDSRDRGGAGGRELRARLTWTDRADHARDSIGITEKFEARDAKRFEAACAALERGWRAGDDDEGPLRLGYRVARKLNRRTWPAGTVSEEFVAIGVEETLDDLIEHARLSAPLDKIEPIIAKYMRD